MSRSARTLLAITAAFGTARQVRKSITGDLGRLRAILEG